MKSRKQIQERIHTLLDPHDEGVDYYKLMEEGDLYLTDFLNDKQQAELATLKWVLEETWVK